ncbi:hypothetical protein KPL47_08945 [Clostridium estertheticum]|uniref:hypothetical protein n=1 Tax=Clostridium estertheticum TaxID=238834 RepID=UPI001C0AA507|nr:hypothetical protein [Clostridium estertheticum]MBU3176499.1 hypothetical protein [Clostridium estertheticum]
MYSYNDITIPKKVLKDLLTKIGEGKYSTFDILKVYQGSVKRNAGISVEKAWNGNFGRILKLCQKDTNGTMIEEVEKNIKIFIDEGPTNTSYWKIY